MFAADSDIELTINVFKQLNTNNESIAFSPVSLLNNLVIIFAGSDGTTAEQISEVIGNGTPKDAIIEKYANMMDIYKAFKDKYLGHIYVKSLFLSVEHFNPTCAEIMQKFNAECKELDFGDNNFLKEINSFVLQQTNNQFSKSITKNDIISMKKSSITIVNSLFVDPKWDNSFTSDGETKFFIPPYTPYSFRVTPCIVCQTGNKGWNFTESETWKCLGIPYKYRKTWLHILLPKERDGLNKLIKKFDVQMLKKCILKNVAKKMDVIIPAFEIESKISFNQMLTNLGITDIFNDKRVTNMLHHPCHINNILHSTTIKIDQTGLQKPLKHSLTLEEQKEQYKKQSHKNVLDFEGWCRAEIREDKDETNEFRADHSFIYFVTLVNENVDDLKSIIAMGKYFTISNSREQTLYGNLIPDTAVIKDIKSLKSSLSYSTGKACCWNTKTKSFMQLSNSLKKRDDIEWYMVYFHQGSVGVIHASNIHETNYLIDC